MDARQAGSIRGQQSGPMPREMGEQFPVWKEELRRQVVFELAVGFGPTASEGKFG
jgi:hypothetical protein